MSISINNLRNQLTSRETLTSAHLCAIKGGDGEDIRNRPSAPKPPPPPPPPTAAAVAAPSSVANNILG
jgi:hypothetical protein